jgi:hypothetical protein
MMRRTGPEDRIFRLEFMRRNASRATTLQRTFYLGKELPSQLVKLVKLLRKPTPTTHG